jgi:hypothetical protein
MNVNVTTTAALLALDTPKNVIIQNVGDADVYLARGSSNVVTRGLRLASGDAIEIADPLGDSGRPYYVATATGSSNLRVLVWS